MNAAVLNRLAALETELFSLRAQVVAAKRTPLVPDEPGTLIHQVAHGFAVGDLVWPGSPFVKPATWSDYDGGAPGIVYRVDGPDDFRVCFSGRVQIPGASYSPWSLYYLYNGVLSAARPDSAIGVPVALAITNDTLVMGLSRIERDQVIQPITQAAHGFTVGTVIYNSSGTYIKADADLGHDNLAIVVKVIDANTFQLQSDGLCYLPSLAAAPTQDYHVGGGAQAGQLIAGPGGTTAYAASRSILFHKAQGYCRLYGNTLRAGHSHYLALLHDVGLSTLHDREALSWSTSGNRWLNLPGLPAASADGQVPVWNAGLSRWDAGTAAPDLGDMAYNEDAGCVTVGPADSLGAIGPTGYLVLSNGAALGYTSDNIGTITAVPDYEAFHDQASDGLSARWYTVGDAAEPDLRWTYSSGEFRVRYELLVGKDPGVATSYLGKLRVVDSTDGDNVEIGNAHGLRYYKRSISTTNPTLRLESAKAVIGYGEAAVSSQGGDLIAVLGTDGDYLRVNGSKLQIFKRSVSTSVPMIEIDLAFAPTGGWTTAKKVKLTEQDECDSGGASKKRIYICSDQF